MTRPGEVVGADAHAEIAGMLCTGAAAAEAEADADAETVIPCTACFIISECFWMSAIDSVVWDAIGFRSADVAPSRDACLEDDEECNENAMANNTFKEGQEQRGTNGNGTKALMSVIHRGIDWQYNA